MTAGVRKGEPIFHLRRAVGTALAIGLALAVISPAHAGEGVGWVERGPYTLVEADSKLVDTPSRNADGSVNALVEIPAGTNAKWELSKEDGTLAWEFENGRPRVVQYLAYPANYGMIPRTLLAAESAGDGDPLDVLILGPALPRGTLVRVRVIGVLQLLDGGECDDKLLAVFDDSPFSGVGDVSELDARFPGVTRILETWFGHYKGAGVIETRGFGSAKDALGVLERSEKEYASR